MARTSESQIPEAKTPKITVFRHEDFKSSREGINDIIGTVDQRAVFSLHSNFGGIEEAETHRHVRQRGQEAKVILSH